MLFPRTLRATALSALVLVFIADRFFYKVSAGWVLGWFLCICLGLLWLRMPRWQRSDRHSIGLTLALVGLGLSLVWNPFSLNSLLSAGGLALLAMGSKTHWHRGPLTSLQEVFGFFFAGWTQIWRDSAIIRRWRESGQRKQSSDKRGSFGQRWKIPLLVSGLFLFLFIQANPLLAKWAGDLFRAMTDPLAHLDWPPLPRIILWVGILFYGWALIRYRPQRLPVPTGHDRTPSKVAEVATVDTVVRSLVLLNALFALMNLLDLRYLWYGAALPDGMTYAEYAQRGAYPLVISALLAAFFVLIAFRPSGAAERSRIAVCLVGLWVAQNILLTLAAGWRLGVYIDVYSLTRLRTAAAIWMALVASGLLWISLRILTHKSNAWLIKRNAITLGSVLYVCAFINFDGYIARYNTERCLEISGQGSQLDWDYLEQLGVEALPALRAIPVNSELPRDFLAKRRKLQAKLEHRLLAESKHWQSWTLLRHRLIANRD